MYASSNGPRDKEYWLLVKADCNAKGLFITEIIYGNKYVEYHFYLARGCEGKVN